MDKLIFTVLNSIKSTQTRQTNNAHEIANVATPGFKKSLSGHAISLDVYILGMNNVRTMPESKESKPLDINPSVLLIL